MRLIAALALGAVALATPEFASAQQAPATGGEDVLKEWEIEWGGRTRDPHVAPDGKVWFVGQAGNYIAWFDPATEERRQYEIEDGTNPHNLLVDDDGYVWYAGNRNGRIGKLNPETGEAEIIMTGDARDPHTLIFDGRGYVWFTSQQANHVGRVHMETHEVEVIQAFESPGRPYGIVIDDEGAAWVALFNTSHIMRVDPATMDTRLYDKATPESRSRRIALTDDGRVWYVDEPRGFLGAIHPATGEVQEWPMPGGDDSRPYALNRDDQGLLWASQTGPDKKLTAFDPEREEFVAVFDVSHNIRHMALDSRNGALWFGTDANQVGRVLTTHVGH